MADKAAPEDALLVELANSIAATCSPDGTVKGAGMDPATIMALIMGLLQALGGCMKPQQAYAAVRSILGLDDGWYLGVRVHRLVYQRRLNQAFNDKADLVGASIQDHVAAMSEATFGALMKRAAKG